MRDYLSLRTLRTATVLSALVTIMSVPRLMQAEWPLDFYLPATFLAMLLVSGAPAAWSEKGGLNGLFPRGRVLPGIGIAILLSLLALPYHYYVAPVVRELLESTGDAELIAMNYPDSISGRIAAVLWCGGFQAMFFYAAPMALFCRLLRRVWPAILLTVAMKVLVVAYGFSQAGIAHGALPAMCASAAATVVASLLYARAGLLPTMVFVAGLNLHLFVF